jgi:hypothetical protein
MEHINLSLINSLTSRFIVPNGLPLIWVHIGMQEYKFLHRLLGIVIPEHNYIMTITKEVLLLFQGFPQTIKLVKVEGKEKNCLPILQIMFLL